MINPTTEFLPRGYVYATGFLVLLSLLFFRKSDTIKRTSQNTVIPTMPAIRTRTTSPSITHPLSSAARRPYHRLPTFNEIIEISSDEEIATSVRKTRRAMRPLLEDLREVSVCTCIFV